MGLTTLALGQGRPPERCHGGAMEVGQSSQTRGRILLIDDDLSLGAYLARVLRTDGRFEVIHELDAATAVRCLENERWDLLITDIEMPGMNGLELVSQARRLAPDLPIAVLTGHATLERVVTALRRSATEFLHKPLAGEDLVSRATALVEAGRKARAGAGWLGQGGAARPRAGR
jgi:two-component system response regulator HydG